MPSEQPPLPVNHPRCAQEGNCRKPGLFSPAEYHVKGYNDPHAKLCRDHLYAAIDAQAQTQKPRRFNA